ncbi:MAG: radical SAM protein [Chitinispirillaceae bacterium]|nr:radical SAM protein [Chitinispirillaceae bacterium]
MVRNIYGFRRRLFNLYIRIVVFLYISSITIRGKIALRNYRRVLGRLEYFLRRMRENKFVSIDGRVRIGLYIPGVPSNAFKAACDKFTVFNDKLPCTTVLVSVTSACVFKCPHCYQKHDRGKDVEIGKLVETVKAMRRHGVAFFNIEGGEPFLAYDRLRAVCEAIGDLSEIWVNSTGFGMSIEKLRELKRRGVTAIMFPLHHGTPEAMNRFMDSDKAWDAIHRGIAMCHETGMPAALNMCLSRDQFFNGEFEACMEEAKRLQAAIIQIIKPKPAGGWLDGGAPDFSDEDLRQVRQKVLMYNHDPRHRDYPAISAQIMEEDAALFGCTCGGTDRYYLNAKGDVQPCEFLNISFGNINEEPFDVIYCRMREAFRVPRTAWLCEKYAGSIAATYRDRGLDALPLTKELSEQLSAGWDRGAPTPLYAVLEGRKTDLRDRRTVNGK